MRSIFNISEWGMCMRRKLHQYLHSDQYINSGNVEQRGQFTHILQNSLLITFRMRGQFMHKRNLLHGMCQWIHISDCQCLRTILRRLSFIDLKLYHLLNTDSMYAMRCRILHHSNLHLWSLQRRHGWMSDLQQWSDMSRLQYGFHFSGFKFVSVQSGD